MSPHQASGTAGTGTGGSAGPDPHDNGERATDIDPLDHAETEALRPAAAGTLADQTDLTDADGDDIREDTGEPVETDEGWVVPQSQNVGDAPPDGELRDYT